MGFSKLVATTAASLAMLASAHAVAQAPQASPQTNAAAPVAQGSPQTNAAAHVAQGGLEVNTAVPIATGPPDFFDNYSLRLGFEMAGPLLFRDTPDAAVEETTVYQLGPRLAVLFGHEVSNFHRAGLGFSYLFVGKSASRSLTFIPLYLLHEVGHPLILQTVLGANLTSGTQGFADNYSGVHTGLALRYSFLSADRWSPVTLSPGIAAKANLVTGDMQYSSVFVGAQVEIMFNTNNER